MKRCRIDSAVEQLFAQCKKSPASIAWTGKDMSRLALWVSGFQFGEFEFVVDKIALY